MLDPLDYENRPYLDSLSRTRRRAFLILTLEHIVAHSWRPLSWGIFFAGLWMLGIPEFFGTTVEILISLIFMGGLLYFTRKDITTFRLPNDSKLDRAIESKTILPRGQIALIEDNLANPKKRETRSLWDEAQKNAVRTLKSLRVPSIRALITRRDPYALRFIAILFFIAGIMVSGQNWQNKIYNGMLPVSIHSLASAPSTAVTLWVTPPAYTKLENVQISGTGTYGETLNIPQGSTIKARIETRFGKYAPPKLNMGGRSYPMENLGDGYYGFETTIEQGSKLSITQSIFPRATWPYYYVIDTPPEIYVTAKLRPNDANHAQNQAQSDAPESNNQSEENPASTEPESEKKPYELIDKAQLRFSLTVKDDYSVKDLHMSMKLADFVEEKPLGDAFEETRLIISSPQTELKISPVYDLSWHTWAGLPVTFEYTVFDHISQSARLEKINLVLPEREFEHPLAKSVIAMRKQLAWQYRDSFSDISYNLETLLSAPDYFQNNPVTYLAIKTASARLKYVEDKPQDQREVAAKEVIRLLWAIAISVEDGNISLAMRELRDAQRELENAMRDPNTSEEEIERLMQNLREKMNNYFAEMQRELQKRMEDGEEFPEFSEEDFGNIISPDALSKLMEEIEQAMRDGDPEKAQELMSKLQRMMEMMDSARNAQLPKDMQVMQDGVNELQELIERQEQLLEQTEKRTAQEMRESWLERDSRREQQQDNQQQSQRNNNGSSERSMQTLQDMLKEFGMTMAPPKPTQNNDEPKQSEQQKQNRAHAKTQDNETGEKKPEIKGQSKNEENREHGNKDKKTAQNNNTDQGQTSQPQQQNDPSSKDQMQGSQTNEEAKTEQDALRYVLGQLMLDVAEHLDEIPETMGEAEQEMRQSAEQLGNNNPQGSLPHQETAIEKLKESQENLSQQFRQRMQQMVGIGSGQGRGKYDPLGRKYGKEEDNNGRTSESDVKIPDEAEKKKIEEIIKELRDRSSDRSRPREELDYFRRLLRQF